MAYLVVYFIYFVVDVVSFIVFFLHFVFILNKGPSFAGKGFFLCKYFRELSAYYLFGCSLSTCYLWNVLRCRVFIQMTVGSDIAFFNISV